MDAPQLDGALVSKQPVPIVDAPLPRNTNVTAGGQEPGDGG